MFGMPLATVRESNPIDTGHGRREAGAVRRVVVVVAMLVSACERSGEEPSGPDPECEVTYAKLEALGCEANMKFLLARGCFEVELAPEDCDTSVLDPCAVELTAFAKRPGGWWEPLASFLDRKCGPEGHTTIDWPKPDTTAVAAERAAAAEAAAAALAESEAAAARARELGIAAAKVKLGAPMVQGALSKASIRKVASEHLDAVRECYGAGLALIPDLAGEVTINFVVTGAGKVGAAVVQMSTVRSSSVGNCIAKAVKTWEFPGPDGGGNVIASLPFTLSRER
jgi:hypothetical protein